MITIDVFREKVAGGRIGTSGKFRLLFTTGEGLDDESIKASMKPGSITKILPFDEFQDALPVMDGVLEMFPEWVLVVLDVSDTGNTAVVAMGSAKGWSFIKRHPLK